MTARRHWEASLQHTCCHQRCLCVHAGMLCLGTTACAAPHALLACLLLPSPAAGAAGMHGQAGRAGDAAERGAQCQGGGTGAPAGGGDHPPRKFPLALRSPPATAPPSAVWHVVAREALDGRPIPCRLPPAGSPGPPTCTVLGSASAALPIADKTDPTHSGAPLTFAL